MRTRLLWAGVCCNALVGCATAPIDSQPLAEFDSASARRHLEAGIDEFPRNAKRARDAYFSKVVDLCQTAFPETGKRVYTARTSAESLLYLVQAAAEKTDASVIDVPCGEASYLAAYASIEIGEVETAEKHLEEARRWSPNNSVYLIELGHVRHIQRRWQDALELFTMAEDFSDIAPEDVMQEEKLRAKRGIGYSLIELGQLDAAKQQYVECLEIDPNDASAKNELKYIEQLLSKDTT